MIRQLHLLLILLFIGSAGAVQSQSLLNSNLYNKNKFSINPAYAGSQEKLFAAFQGNTQNTSVSNSPQFFMFNIHAPVKDNLGLGLNIYQGNSGFFETTVVDFNVAYTANLSEDHAITFGISSGYVRERLDRFSGNFNDFVDGSDPTLQGEYYDQGQLKIGTGLVYRTQGLEISAAFPKLMRTEGGLNFNFVTYAGYSIANSDESWVFTPSLLYQVPDGNENLIDLNFMAEWNSLLWAQAGYRTNGAINFGLGATLESIGIGYSYGYATGDMSEIVSSIHEVLISFTLKENLE
jgi:type IX secretion system PorP/SprF family membrane protein